MGAKKSVCIDFNSNLLSLANESKIEKIISNVEIFKTSSRYDLILCLGILEFLDKPEKNLDNYSFFKKHLIEYNYLN